MLNPAYSRIGQIQVSAALYGVAATTPGSRISDNAIAIPSYGTQLSKPLLQGQTSQAYYALIAAKLVVQTDSPQTIVLPPSMIG